MNKETFSHSQRGVGDNECALVVNNLNYNTFSSDANSINCDNWLYNNYQNASNGSTKSSKKLQQDPYDYAYPRNANSFWGTVLHIYMISAGPALFLMPRAFFAVGYFTAFVLMLVIFYIYWYNMRMIVWSETQLLKIKHRPCMTYPETIFHSFDVGPSGVRWLAPYSYLAIRLLFMITWIGAFELVIISSNLRLICKSAFDTNLDTPTSMLIIFVPMLLLTLIHRIKYLVPLSAIADGISLFCILTVIVHIFIDPRPLTIEPDVGSLENVPILLGSTLFAINATGLMLPLKNEMQEPRRFDSRWGVLSVTYPVISFVYAFFGLFCSLKFGSELLQHDTVIECVGARKNVLDIIMSLYTLSIALQYPLITYVVFDTIWNNFLKNKRDSMRYKVCTEYAVRAAVYLVSFGVSYGLPQLNLILSVCGTIGTAVDSLIFPAVINSLLTWKLDGNGRKAKLVHVKNSLIIVMAILVLYAGLTVSVSQLRSRFNNFSNITGNA